MAGAPVVLNANQWFGGAGVAVCASSTDPVCGGEQHVGGWSGNWWQCVELAQRFYQTKGWHSGIFSNVSYAYQIYDKAAALGMTRQGNGGISSIRPGDMIVHGPNASPYDGGAGHVAIIDSISGSTVNVVEQNGSSTGRAVYTLSNGSLSRSGMVNIRGVVHDPDNKASAGSPGSPRGSLDVVSQNGTGVRFQGWATDPDTSAPIAVHTYVTPQHGVATTANLNRADVGAHAFDVTRGGIVAGTYNVCAYAINAPGTPGQNTTLGCRSFTVTQSPIGHLDVVSQNGTGVRFRGWAVDPDTSAPIAVHAYVTPRHGVATTANLDRPDVAIAMPATGAAHGFDVTRGGIVDGTYNVCAYAINTPGTPGQNTPLGCRSFTVN